MQQKNFSLEAPGAGRHTKMNRLLFTGGTVLLPTGFRRMDAAVSGTVISALAPDIVPEEGDAVVDLQGDLLVPGFIDMHVHGGGGADFMDGTADAFLTACRVHARHGTTTLYPTALTAADEDMDAFFAALETADTARKAAGASAGARIGGVHVEGPWLAPAQAGAQDPKYLRTPSAEECEKLLARSDRIAVVTMAPELDGACGCASLLAARGVLPAMGHSAADLEQVRTAVDSGFRHMVHFYSAMSTVRRENSYRIPGMVEAGYLFDAVTVEAIADGHHLPLSLLRLIHKVKGPERMVLVTDAMRGAGMPEGPSVLGSLKNGREVLVEGGVARLPDRSGFAGSVCTMDRAVRTAVSAGIPLEDALRMASGTPSKILGTTGRRGAILPGMDADLVRLDGNLNVIMTVVGGTIFDENC